MAFEKFVEKVLILQPYFCNLLPFSTELLYHCYADLIGPREKRFSLWFGPGKLPSAVDMFIVKATGFSIVYQLTLTL